MERVSTVTEENVFSDFAAPAPSSPEERVETSHNWCEMTHGRGVRGNPAFYSYAGRKVRIPQLHWTRGASDGPGRQRYAQFHAVCHVKEAILFHTYVGNDTETLPRRHAAKTGLADP